MAVLSVSLAIMASPLAWSAEADTPGAHPAIHGEESKADGAGDSPEPLRKTPEAGEPRDSGIGEKSPGKRLLTPEETLSLAQFLLSKNRVDDAERIYRFLLNSRAGEDIRIEAAFQIGQILVSRGRYREAAQYFIAILNYKPDLSRVRLELARAYFLDKNYPDATLQFELVKGGNLPPEVLVNVDAFLDLIRRQKNWTFNFAMSPVSDSNINQASGNREECVDVLGMTLCRPLAEKASGIGLNLNANLDYFKRLSQDWGLRASAGFSALEYKGRAFDDYSLYAALGPRYLWASGEASVQPTFRKRWYAGKSYRDEYGLRADGRKVWSRLILDASASYARNSYADAFLDSMLRGASWGASLQPRYVLNDRTFILAGLEFMREDAREKAYANDNLSYSLGVYRVLPYGFSLYLGGSLTESKYRASQWYVTKDNRIDVTTRRDKIWGMTTFLSSNRLEKYNLTPILRYSYTKRTSNIWSREYERNRVDFLMNLRI